MTEPTTEMTDQHRRRALIGVYASVAATGIAWGTLVPLMPILMEQQGYSDTAIGINAAMPVLAVLTIGPLMGLILRRLGLATALFGGLAIITLALVALSIPQAYVLGLALRYVVGLGGGLHWILSETWINTCAPPAQRGFYVGIYATLFTLGFVAGPLVVSVLDIASVWPFLFIAACVVVSGVVLWRVYDSLPPVTHSPHVLEIDALRAAPILYLSVFAAGMLDSALWAMFPVFGLGMGAAVGLTLALTAALNAGTVGSQIGIGWLADRVGVRRMILVCAALIVGAAAVLPGLFNTTLVWPLLFLIGAALGGLYSLPMTEMGQRFTGPQLTGASALFVMIYSVGSLIGPPLSGAAMDWFGPAALTGYAIVMALLFLAVAIPATVRAQRPSAAE